MNQSTELRRQLIEEGYCCLPGVASKGLIDQIRKIADRTAERSQEGTSNTSELQGSIIDVLGNPEMAPLISLPSAQKALCELGFTNLKFYSGYIISKPPEIAPALFWHQDGFVWDDPISYTDTPVQFFLMYYLINTNQNNGCLRVIPGSHRKRHRLHGLPPAHSKEIQNATNGHPALEFDPDEVDVPVKAGDLVVEFFTPRMRTGRINVEPLLLCGFVRLTISFRIRCRLFMVNPEANQPIGRIRNGVSWSRYWQRIRGMLYLSPTNVFLTNDWCRSKSCKEYPDGMKSGGQRSSISLI